ncbi:MAG: hypothetical protein LBD41_00985 [Clostridiales Family XIII bacterium]|jgi:hypothetical protein|nr:hypothetical protein [Clostridiales Family XIII bacterium]
MEKLKKIIYVLIFIFLLTLSINCVNGILNYKTVEGFGHWYEYYKEKKNSIDVLLLGSSHIMRQINPSVIFREKGISSFDIATGGESLWATYYSMQEALKYQNPKVIVVDVFMARLDGQYYDDAHNITTTFGQKRDTIWVNNILSSVPKNRSWYFARYPLYHGRYKEINKTDFINKEERYKSLLKGFWVDENNFKVKKIAKIEYKTIGGLSKNWNKKNEKYLKKIISLAKRKNIKLLFIQTPAIFNDKEILLYNHVKEIAKNSNIPYLECNRYMDGIKLNENTDFRDKDHLNYKGSNKLSKWFAILLSEKYNLKNHKGDSDFNSYEKEYKLWQKYIKTKGK